MMADPVSVLPASLGLVRLLKSFGGKALPVGFVAERLGVPEIVARQRIDELAVKQVVRIDRDQVTLIDP